MRIGIDIGSTTIKCVALDENDKIIYSVYERHYSHILEKVIDLFLKLAEILPEQNALIAFSGSAGMGLADFCGTDFVQEVFATQIAAKRLSPGTDCIIELGGEDAKILFLTNGTEVRMNGSCAGGTGAFIDQMATLLKMTADEMNLAAKSSKRMYTIASRCGVFAKSDIQPLINQGAEKADIAASIYQAVVNQTIAGLSQGRAIRGKVLYLGGPLTFSDFLQERFNKELNITGICPENSLLFVSLGAAFYAEKSFNIKELCEKIKTYSGKAEYEATEPLFKTKEEYEEFVVRHNKATVKKADFSSFKGNVHIGIDSGSTTVKLAVIDDNCRLLYEKYMANRGNPAVLVKDALLEIYDLNPNITIKSTTVTGYGEELIKKAFSCDIGVVETVAHFTAAKHFLPEVDFIIDIGGQDMKCFKIENGAISDIFLNEACSSGCGSFLQTFAEALGYSSSEFAKLGLFADRPVDLGSRCTVFMNSSVKQAQKDGVTVENISAGLSSSVVKNALYKVIRITDAASLGKNIVVQGGTFYNEAVLRAFERELNTNVVRPDIAGRMGAVGAALYGEDKVKSEKSSVLDKNALLGFTQTISNVKCGACTNNCQLTVNTFSDGTKYISGNRCERPITGKASICELNLYEYKQSRLKEYMSSSGSRGKIGIPLCLNMYELLPFWHTFFKALGFSVKTSSFSSREQYQKGQASIPSDTVCFPAKLAHGHIKELSEQNCDAIFYPCMTYNIDENLGDNHYNCPVVAYYPEVIKGNMSELYRTQFIYDYVDISRKKDFPKKITDILKKYFYNITRKEVDFACKAAYCEYEKHMADLRKKSEEIIKKAREEKRKIIVLAGRPYHADPEINHSIDKLIIKQGAAVLTEDSVSQNTKKFKTSVLNQWTYHSRLYAAAKFCSQNPDCELVQLVSFGCGLDAVTTDETKEILQNAGKLYTQIKIDEITNLGAVNIRLRSLFAAIKD